MEKKKRILSFYNRSVPRLASVEYDYVARDRGELSLQKGGVVTVLEQNEGWWKGDLNGNIGTFPANVRGICLIILLFIGRI
jgi:hypothetical protein